MTETKIKEITYMKGYQMDILLGNGHRIIYNMQNKLITARFRDLTDWEVFSSGQIVDSERVIRWNDSTELSVAEIMMNVKNEYKLSS